MIIRYRIEKRSRSKGVTPRALIDRNRSRFFKIHNREKLAYECSECGKFSSSVKGVCGYCVHSVATPL